MSTLRPIFAWTGIVALTYALAGCATYEKCGLEGCPGDIISAAGQGSLVKHSIEGSDNQPLHRQARSH